MSITPVQTSQGSRPPEIYIAGDLTPNVLNLIELSKPYHTVVLLYEDDFSDNILAAFAELDRLNLKTKKVGTVFSSIEVHSFGLNDFEPGTIIELSVRESSRDASRQSVQRIAYRSLLNELLLLSVRIRV